MMINKFFFKIIYSVAIIGLLASCAFGPSKGMGYLDRYPTGGFHTGLDLWGSVGTEVLAAKDGKVTWAQVQDGAIAPRLTIDYEWEGKEYQTQYYHIADPLVKKGDFVKQGQVVARLALTGERGPNDPRTIGIPHLHLELFVNGARKNPEIIKWECPSKERPKVEWIWPVGC
jgi:murein DD-endopeptidase MepM/ murein hydrolase activator NlpD